MKGSKLLVKGIAIGLFLKYIADQIDLDMADVLKAIAEADKDAKKQKKEVEKLKEEEEPDVY